MSDWSRYIIPPPSPPAPIKRKVFISYCHSDQKEAEWFVWNWRNVFTHRALGMSFTNDIVNSDNAAYVMSRIRSEYLGDSSVTVVLMGNCTRADSSIGRSRLLYSVGLVPRTDWSHSCFHRRTIVPVGFTHSYLRDSLRTIGTTTTLRMLAIGSCLITKHGRASASRLLSKAGRTRSS